MALTIRITTVWILTLRGALFEILTTRAASTRFSDCRRVESTNSCVRVSTYNYLKINVDRGSQLG